MVFLYPEHSTIHTPSFKSYPERGILNLLWSSLSFWDIGLKFCTSLYLTKKLLICRNRRYRTAIAYSCQTNWLIHIRSMYEKIFYLTIYLHEIWHRLLSKVALQSQIQVLVWKTFIFVNAIMTSMQPKLTFVFAIIHMHIDLLLP